ncbi:serine hydrolase [Streptomyces venezuelae]|uniref:serine hydrolase n=1 Tax=Streptomyces venezuelae TaxID=54571 RepID=UPI00332A130E
MKAVTVAGGSSDDPETEAETTVLEGEPKTTAEDGADGGGEPEAAAEAGPELPGEADSELPGEGRSATEATPDGEAEPDGGLPGAAEPEARPEAGTDKETGPEDDAELPHRPDPEDKAHTKQPGDTWSTTDTAPDSEAEPKAEHPGAAEAEAGTDKETGPEDDAELPRQADPEEKANTEQPGDTRSTTDTAPDSEAAPEADAGTAGETGPEDEAELPRQPNPEDKAHTEQPGDTRSTTDTAPDSEAAPDAEHPGATEPEPEAGTDGEAAPKAHAGSEGEAGSEPEGEAGRGVTDRPGAAAVAADADIDDGDDGGDGDGDGDRPGGGSGPKDRAGTAVEDPSDQTMLIAVPKAEPAEPDAPRTAPSWARKAEPDPERTSQFVALKDVDLPAPVAPRAQPQPTEDRLARPAPAAPLPPLDLLAELTNTPAPPETPRRTAVRRVKIWTPILLLLVGAGVGAQLLRPLPTPQLVAADTDRAIDGQFSIPWPAKGQGAVRVSGSGDLGTFGEQKPVPTASVAKVMTAYVILKSHPLRKSDPGPDITVDAKAVADGGSEHESRIRSLTVGQKFSQQDMLKMLMIPSGNNIGRLLARWDSGTDSEAAFVAKMNAAAKELGMDSTTYTDPSGLDSATVSTAADQLKLAEAVMKDEVFRTIVALPNATIKGLPERLENNNILLNSQGLSIRGIKTGSSTPAGGTLMWAAYRTIGDETPLILGTLMDQHADGPDEDGADSLKLVLANSKKIIEAVRNALASAPVVRKGDVVGHLDDGLGGRTPLVATKDLNVIGVPGQQLKLSLTVPAGAGPLPHTAKAGTEVAVLTVGSGESAKNVPVAVKGALAEPDFGTRLTRGR